MSLLNYLEVNGLTYEAFGHKIGVSATAVYRYTRGLRFPTRRVFEKIKSVTNGEVTYESFPPLKKPKTRTN